MRKLLEMNGDLLFKKVILGTGKGESLEGKGAWSFHLFRKLVLCSSWRIMAFNILKYKADPFLMSGNDWWQYDCVGS